MAKLVALTAASGHVTYQNQWWKTVADPDGNEVDVFPLSEAYGVIEGEGSSGWRVNADRGQALPDPELRPGCRVPSKRWPGWQMMPDCPC